MSEQATETPAPEAKQQEGQDPAATPEAKPEEQPQTFDKEYVEKLRKEAAEYRTKARDASRELESVRQSSMSEAEKAVAEAEARGRTAAASEFGKRLARTEFDAFAGRRNPDFKTAEVFEWLDLSRFVGEDGEPDTKAIQSAVERLVPSGAEQPPPSFDGGSRSPAPAGTDMNSILRRSTGRA